MILKSAKQLSSIGKLDDEFKKEVEDNKKKSKRVLGAIMQGASALVCIGLVSIALVSGIYRINGRQIVTNNHVSFAIVSNSMEGYYSEAYKNKLIGQYSSKYSIDLSQAETKIERDQFTVGDFVQFNVLKKDADLKVYDVYGYKNSDGKIITHRYIGEREDGTLIFRGDNAPGEDVTVKREQILYHYQGKDIKHIGLVILFFGSGYGIYSIIAVIAIYVISDIAIIKWERIKNDRLEELGISTKKEKRIKHAKS
ncbi:MAG: hypothetical protein IJK27_04070 [Bacilli bacterium]|nr:hypothetical protein [Bacilli bacterium]